MASKNGFLICNACSHSHSPTLHLSQRYSLFFCLSLSFYAPFSFFFPFIKRVLEDERSSLFFLFFFSLKALSKVLCVDSLRYLQERLALQHLLPAVPSRCAIMREEPEDSGASYPKSPSGISSSRPPFGLATIAYQHASGTPRCMNSFDFVCIRTRSAYRTVWCEPDTVSSWHPLPFDSSQPATRSTGYSDTSRSKCSSRLLVFGDDASPGSSRNALD